MCGPSLLPDIKRNSGFPRNHGTLVKRNVCITYPPGVMLVNVFLPLKPFACGVCAFLLVRFIFELFISPDSDHLFNLFSVCVLGCLHLL